MTKAQWSSPIPTFMNCDLTPKEKEILNERIDELMRGVDPEIAAIINESRENIAEAVSQVKADLMKIDYEI